VKNLIDDPNSQKEINRLRGEMEVWMKKTSDPLLPLLQKRDDANVREAYMKKVASESAERSKKKGGRSKGKNAED
jgi:hypothetical protein